MSRFVRFCKKCHATALERGFLQTAISMARGGVWFCMYGKKECGTVVEKKGAAK